MDEPIKAIKELVEEKGLVCGSGFLFFDNKEDEYQTEVGFSDDSHILIALDCADTSMIKDIHAKTGLLPDLTPYGELLYYVY